jgi:outer membrane protein assembly factor BamD (BamD/ComL family)
VSEPSPQAVTPALTEAPPSTLEAEATLLRQGVAALHEGQPGQALAAFDEHARRFPRSVLAEERSAERIFALCDLGQTDAARNASASFLATYRGSPLAVRVAASCGARTIP